MLSIAEVALKALGWNVYDGHPLGLKHDECVFLFADGTLQAGGPPRRIIKHNSADAFVPSGGTTVEYAVAYRPLASHIGDHTFDVAGPHAGTFRRDY